MDGFTHKDVQMKPKKQQKCQICKAPIPEGKEKYKDKIIMCGRCYFKKKKKWRGASINYLKWVMS